MINEVIKVNSEYRERVKSYIQKKELYIKPNFKPLYISDLKNWEINKGLSKTEYIYLHSLLIVKDLIKNSLTDKIDYSNYACQIIINWWNKNQNNDLAWNEHAVAERTLNIIYFQENSTKKIEQKTYETILEMHLEFLYNSNNYKSNNHGLMMDRSLLVGSLYSHRDIYRERAIERFNVFVYRDFSRAGIHLENSPEYHALALKLSQEFIYILRKSKIVVNKDVENIISNAEKYISKIARPDKSIPMLGDSGHKILLGNKRYGSIKDHISGVFLYQDVLRKNWLLVSNGYQKTTHKHKDDMSVQFSIDSLNLLVDSGKYNYDINSKVRRYLISDHAHSKPYILNRRFKFDANERLETNIILNTSDIYHIETSYLKRKDFHILRNIILHKATSTLFIVDRFSAEEQSIFVSNFILDPDLKLKVIGDNEIEFSDTKYSIVTEHRKLNHITKDQELNNWYSTEFNKIETTNKVFLRSRAKKKTHITYIKNIDTSVDINITKNNLNLFINNMSYIINISNL